jgi:hypothetical protein
VFAVEALRFALAGVYELSIAEGWQDAAGVVGLAVVVMAGYTMFALSLESAHGRTVAPLGRRAEGATAMSEPLAGQVDAVEHEAGVRKQL